MSRFGNTYPKRPRSEDNFTREKSKGSIPRAHPITARKRYLFSLPFFLNSIIAFAPRYAASGPKTKLNRGTQNRSPKNNDQRERLLYSTRNHFSELLFVSIYHSIGRFVNAFTTPIFTWYVTISP